MQPGILERALYRWALFTYAESVSENALKMDEAYKL